jgi:L-threonylcarbamoyladenylate synthase
MRRKMVEIIKMRDADIARLGRRIRAGEVFAYPTDTVYGIGCDATNAHAVERVFEIKGRDFKKPLSLAFHSIEQIKRYAEVDEKEELALKEKLPGPYTFILRNKKVSKRVTAGLDTVAVRIPDNRFVVGLVNETGVPIVTTSANLSGHVPALCLDDIPACMLGQLDFAVDAGMCGSGKPSVIINLLDGKILR